MNHNEEFRGKVKTPSLLSLLFSHYFCISIKLSLQAPQNHPSRSFAQLVTTIDISQHGLYPLSL